MRRWLAFLFLLVLDAGAQTNGRWWIGFMDTEDRAFLEIPGDPRACAERDALAHRFRGAPGSILRSRLSPAGQIGAGGRLVFGIVDLDGRASERVMTRVAAIVREDEGRKHGFPSACWYLAEGRVDDPGAVAREDRLIFGVNPPRGLTVRPAEASWKSFGVLREGADGRFLASDALATPVRQRLVALLPGADQFHAQAFEAVVDRATGPETLWLIGAIARGNGPEDAADTYATVNLILRSATLLPDAPPRFQAGPTAGIGRDRVGSYVAQVIAAADLDGDGVDELVLRARHYSGGNLKVLKWNGEKYVLVRQSGYEGE